GGGEGVAGRSISFDPHPFTRSSPHARSILGPMRKSYNAGMTIDLILGTAGHIDHGKTSLVKALTGTDTDRLPEEKRRGITIELGFAELVLGEYRLGVAAVPGHERFVRDMLAGAAGRDLGPRPVA